MRIPWKSVDWKNSVFLIGTFLVTLTAVPLYLWRFGLGQFQATLFAVFFLCTGISITLGYHRLFSHRTFKASWPVRLFTLLFGAAAFENFSDSATGFQIQTSTAVDLFNANTADGYVIDTRRFVPDAIGPFGNGGDILYAGRCLSNISPPLPRVVEEKREEEIFEK